MVKYLWPPPQTHKETAGSRCCYTVMGGWEGKVDGNGNIWADPVPHWFCSTLSSAVLWLKMTANVQQWTFVSVERVKRVWEKRPISFYPPLTRAPHNPSRVEYQQRIKTRKHLDRVNSIHPSRPECLKSAVRKWFTNGNKLPAHISHSNGFIRLLFQWVRIEYFCLTSV